MTRPILLLLALMSLSLAVPAAASPFAGSWSGVLRRAEAETPVRLHIDQQNAVAVDLPALVYAWQPAPAAADAGALTVELPFGIGAMALSADGDRLTANRGSFALDLRRTSPPPFTRIDMEIAVEGAGLPAELYTPVGLTAPAPLVIVAAGSGRGDGAVAWGIRSWCDLFVRRGLHCLVYPRRPDRGEDGSVSTLRQDAVDLAAVVEAVRVRPGVDPSRVGLFAGSRGVWIGAAAAADGADIDFMILTGAPATTPSDQDIAAVSARMTVDGRAPGEIADAIAYQRLYFYVAHTGRDWPALEAMVRRAEAEPWGEYVDQPRTLDDLAWWRANGDHDPRPDYRAVRMPVLAIWGGDDLVTPPELHAPLLRQLMADNADARFEVFAEGDHRGEHPPGPGPDGVWRWFAMAPGLLETIDAWLVEQGLAAP